MTGSALSVAVVGFGRMAGGYADDPVMARHYPYASHSQVLRDHPRFRWDWAIDPDEAARGQAQSAWGVPNVAGSVEDACSRGCRPDLVVLATPPSLRWAALAPFEGLKAALVEKPLGIDAAASADFAGRCAERGILTQVNLWRRADRTFRDLAGGGLERAIGRPQAATVIYGNGLHNNGVHMVDFVRMLCGEISAVQAVGRPRPGPHLPIPEDRDVDVALELETGVTAMMQAVDFRRYRENGIQVWGTEGRLTVAQEGLTVAIHPVAPNRGMQGERELDGDAGRLLASTVGTALYDMYENLAAAVDGREQLVSPLASALTDERVIDAIEKSIAAGGARVAVRP